MNRRVQSMDFLRAIAILTVMVGHSVLSYGAPSYLNALQFGGSGVDLFFILSGWLLGGQLFKELNTKKHIDVKRFWYRRWMRTLPAYYAVLIFTVFQRYLTKDNVSFPWDYFFFVQNYNAPLEFFSVSWSLCVEEQFYLVIAPLLLLSKNINKNSLTLGLLLLFVLPEIFRSLDLYGFKNETHVRLDGCVLGVFLANIKYNYRFIWDKLASQILPIFLITLILYFASFYMKSIGQTDILPPNKLFLTLMFGVWVVFANSDSKFSAMMYFPGAKYIATRAYALYLLHPEALALIERLPWHFSFAIYVLLTFLLSSLLAEILYRLIEKPFMDMRERLQTVKQVKTAAV
ncbi:acyltransferase [Paraglaciecola agarilytica]|uniref:acyltransferase family protein n=1 Tax=Paraglaciecola chathamensis TaxID=368405 RepID=UPI001C093AE3|nr:MULTISPECIES: acyltransferase [Paraglaciecola]MBU3017176.1 acyltransferase [Paraglaciecola agarilytica]MDO6558278.1 acyltransferase [Paraglaciecola chathamensis]MDO6838887.1 acyltransferase [Paraglaciecola chathamensis]